MHKSLGMTLSAIYFSQASPMHTHTHTAGPQLILYTPMHTRMPIMHALMHTPESGNEAGCYLRRLTHYRATTCM